MAAAGRADALAAKRYFSRVRPRSILGDPGTQFIWGGGKLVDAWPPNQSENRYTQVQRSSVDTLLIGGALDFAAPPQVATRELLPYLPNGRQVVLPGYGHSTSFWMDQPEAGTRLINAFLARGRVDTSLYKPQSVDFTPEVTQTALGKGIGGTMVGLALLTVVSLLWLPFRAHRRGRFGRKAGVTLRSLYPVVLGLGGWFLAVLIVTTWMPGRVALDDEVLAALSVGAPIGLAIYFAWVDRAWSGRAKAIGFAAAHLPSSRGRRPDARSTRDRPSASAGRGGCR